MIYTKEKFKLPEVATVSHARHRERLLKTITEMGLENTNDILTLEFILTYILPRVDTNPISHRLLEKFGSISAVLDATPEELVTVRGVGERTAKMLTLLPQIFTRYNKDRLSHCKVLSSKGTMVKYCASLLQNKPTEQLYAICLNKTYKVLGVKLLSQGSSNQVLITSAEFLRLILAVPNTEYVTLTHSHPDGSCQPSPQDEITTTKFKTLLSTVNLTLLEHVIVGSGKAFALLENRTYEL